MSDIGVARALIDRVGGKMAKLKTVRAFHDIMLTVVPPSDAEETLRVRSNAAIEEIMRVYDASHAVAKLALYLLPFP